MKKVLIMMTTACLLFTSCGDSPKNSSNSSTEDTRRSNGYDDGPGYSNGTSSNYDGYNTSDNEFFTCQMCGGSGMMVYFDGTPMNCIGCNGRGGITRAELQQMAEEMYNQGGNSSGGYYDNTSKQGRGNQTALLRLLFRSRSLARHCEITDGV